MHVVNEGKLTRRQSCAIASMDSQFKQTLFGSSTFQIPAQEHRTVLFGTKDAWPILL
jgi:hypothetical protein